jgi:hypothetical protein
MALNQEAIAAAVAKEIERQQKEVVYEDLSVDELNKVCEQLTAKLEMVKAAAAKKGGKAEAAAMKARKVDSSAKFPELPWGGVCLPDDCESHAACARAAWLSIFGSLARQHAAASSNSSAA